MIRTLLIGAARALFLAAVFVAGLAVVLAYCSWRLVRATVAKDRTMPVRDAGFGMLVAAAALARAVKAQADRQ